MFDTVLKYKGAYDSLPLLGERGDIIIVDNIEYVYVDTWELLGGNYHTQEMIEVLNTSIPKLTNCVNCGAVLITNTCEYCGTTY